MDCRSLIDLLIQTGSLSHEQWVALWSSYTRSDRLYAAEAASEINRKIFGCKVYIRGIVEFSNFCGNDCFYCGIRRSNKLVERYNMSDELILECCQSGFDHNIRSFVLQSGERAHLDLSKMTDLIKKIRSRFPDCAITLSLGELSLDEYTALRKAGADRYLLRHESANAEHYRKLHPADMKLANRLQCLENLHRIGFQTGCGIMLGSPFQTAETLADDMIYMAKFKPEMIGVGPFIPHKDTPFAAYPAGKLEDTLMMISLCRIMLPDVLLPATTALGTLTSDGREQGVLAGANVIMPNLTPKDVQNKYNLYDNKIHTDREISATLEDLSVKLNAIGYSIAHGRGDYGEKRC